MPRTLKLAVLLISGIAVCLIVLYQIAMHSRLDAQASFIEQTVEARMPTQLSGMIPLTSEFLVSPDAEAVWNKRGTEEKAKLSKTWFHALGIAVGVQNATTHGSLPSTSVSLQSTKPEYRLDGWERPFCLVSVGNEIAILSSGVSNDPLPVCSGFGSGYVSQISRLSTKRLYLLPTGYVLLLVDVGRS